MAVAANDSLMRSLPEVSKTTGIPMPIVLRLANEHPKEVPSMGSGSQRFFPEGVVPVLLALYRKSDAPRNEHRPVLLTIARQKREKREAADRQPVEPEKVASSALARRLDGLEGRQLRIIGVLEELLARLRDPWIETATASS